VTAMIYVDPSTLENGCLHVPTNWRRDAGVANGAMEILPYTKGGPNHGNIIPEVAKALQWDPILASPRDLLLFDSYVPHSSEINNSQRSRRAMLITFNAAEEGNFYGKYYQLKRSDPNNPVFHFATPTVSRALEAKPIITASSKL